MCQQCHERPAQYHLTSVVEGQTVQELHLCERCAAEREVIPPPDAPVSVHGWLASLLGGLGEGASAVAPPGAGAPAALRCARCGITYAEFARTGLLGCPDCYDAFAKELDPVVRRAQGRTRHEGKVPSRTGDAIRRRRELADLRRELDAAVGQQAFERAAALRDRIRALEGGARA